MWFHNHRTGINLNFHTFEKEERMSGWQWKSWLSLRRKERQVWGRVHLPEWTLIGLWRVSSSSRGTERTQKGSSQRTFKRPFSLLSLHSQSPPWGLGDSSCLPGRPSTAHGFQEFHPVSPAITLLPFLNSPFPSPHPCKSIFPTSSALPFDLLLPWDPLETSAVRSKLMKSLS